MKSSILMIHSYKGGCGKTIFSVNIANLLVKQFNKSVLLIESDFTMPSFQSIFKQFTPDLFLNNYLQGEEDDLNPYIYKVDKKFGIIYCGEDYNSNDYIHQGDQQWYLTKKEQIERGIKDLNYDFVIFDLSPGMSLFAINTFLLADRIFLLMSADVQSLRGTNYLLGKVYSKIASVTERQIYTIINQSPDHPAMGELLKSWENKLKVSYKFMTDIKSVKYNASTSFATANDNFLLSEDDETLKTFEDIVRTSILSEGSK